MIYCWFNLPMASFRRTLSPAYHDRSYQNGDGGSNPFSVSSPSHKLLYGSNYSSSHFSSSSTLYTGLRRFVAGISLLSYSRKGNQPWKWALYRFLLCFLIGLLIGFTPFLHVHDDDGGGDDDDSQLHLHAQPSQDRIRHRENLVLDTVNLLGLDHTMTTPLPQKQLILVTPTYNRPLQAYYLNRLAQALALVPPPLLWIVVEMNSASPETSHLLSKTGVVYRHLVCTVNSTNVKDRGVHQRNTALYHIAEHKLDGVVYFADDDNIYSLQLFESLRQIRRFGTWPVAMLAQSKSKAILEGPVCNGSRVIGWHTNEKSKRLRRFHVDMSGFAFNSTILWDPKRWNRTSSKPIRQLDTVKEGFQETTFIEQVVEDEFGMEGIPYDCLRVMNWHLHLDARNVGYPRGWMVEKNLDVSLPLG